MNRFGRLSLIALLSLSLLGELFFSIFNSKEVKEVKADNLTAIGLLYKAQHVTSTTKVYISQDDISYITAAGREVYSELYIPPLNDGGLEIESIGGDDLDHINPPTIRYYYYANAANPILSWKMLYNDYESLVFAIEFLENAFYYLNPSANIKNAVLAYIRGIDTKYFSNYISIPHTDLNIVDIMNAVCGETNVDNILGIAYSSTPEYQYQFLDDYKEQFNLPGIQVKKFFNCFVEDIYNESVYGSVDLPPNQMHLRLMNPANNNANIDLIHMFASMDGCFIETGQSTTEEPILHSVSSNIYRYVVSWAGDLQTAASKIYSMGITINSFENVLGNVNPYDFNPEAQYAFEFDWCDYYADLDAFNMAFNVNLNIDTRKVSEIVEDYYSSFNSSFSREELFVHKIAYARHEIDVFDFEDFVYVVRLMMNLDMNGNDLYNVSLFNCASFIPYYYMCEFTDYIFGIPTNIVILPNYNRNVMANLFCDYFEQLII